MNRRETLSFGDLLTIWEESNTVYLALLSGLYDFAQNLSNQASVEAFSKREFGFVPGPHKMHDAIFFTGKRIVDSMESIGQARGYTSEKSRQHFIMTCAHAIRTRYVNIFYETLRNYLEGKDSGKRKRLKDKLNKQPWYRMLELIRHNASHADNYGTYIKPDWRWHEDEVRVGSLKVTKDDVGHEIRYNDRELLELTHSARGYLIQYRSDFE